MTILLDTADALVTRATRAGADAADALAIESTELNTGVRAGVPETIERAESQAIGLRVLVGKAQATLSTADMSDNGLARLVENALAIAKASPEDPYAGLADASLLGNAATDLDMADPQEPDIDTLLERARLCEEAGRAVDGITNSEGADAGFSRSHIALASSHGIAASYSGTSSSISASMIAGTGETMQRDYAYSVARHAQDMRDAHRIGAEAAQRTLDKMHPQKLPSATMPVLFEPRVAKQLLAAFGSAINGAAIARGTSFLKEKMGAQVFANSITITDDPLRKRGQGSRPIDAEGVAPTPRALVKNGILQSWLLDCRTARQLGLQTTGHASRGLSSAPSPSSSNLFIHAGDRSVAALLKDAGDVFVVTETFGHGINMITGDYSQGASGFLYKNGEKHVAVSEVTIAGNLADMFLHATPANDLAFDFATNSPSLLIASMTVAGT
jgi:PmbA protein